MKRAVLLLLGAVLAVLSFGGGAGAKPTGGAGAQPKAPASGCPAGKIKSPKGVCVTAPTCGPNQDLILGKCFPKCQPGQTHSNDGKCVGCPTGYHEDGAGKCVKSPTCGPNEDLILGKCFAKCPAGKVRNNQGKCQ